MLQCDIRGFQELEGQARANGYAAHLATSLAEAEALLDETR